MSRVVGLGKLWVALGRPLYGGVRLRCRRAELEAAASYLMLHRDHRVEVDAGKGLGLHVVRFVRVEGKVHQPRSRAHRDAVLEAHAPKALLL